jgi:hypothetical protein
MAPTARRPPTRRSNIENISFTTSLAAERRRKGGGGAQSNNPVEPPATSMSLSYSLIFRTGETGV